MTLTNRTAEAIDRSIAEQCPDAQCAVAVMKLVGSELLAKAALREAAAHLEATGFRAAAREIREHAK